MERTIIGEVNKVPRRGAPDASSKYAVQML